MNKRLIYYLFFSTIVLIITSSIFYYLLLYGLKRTTRDEIGKFNYIIRDTTQYNMVFIGASTSHLGLNPLLFDSLTNHSTNSFNAAMDGISILEANLIIHKWIKAHGAPKNLTIDFVADILYPEKRVYYFPQYYPYINDPDFAPLINYEPRLLYGRYFPPMAITYLDDPLKSLGLIGLLRSNAENPYLKTQRGYLGVNRLINEDAPPAVEYFGASENGWEILNDAVEYCQSKKVNVCFLISPVYNATRADTTTSILEKLKSYGNKHNVKTIDLLTDKRFASSKLFADRQHLNADGAYIYTSILSKEFDIVK
jgi:hypothetical protein